MSDDIEKIKYHIRLLAEALDYETHPIPSLVVSFDWDDNDLDAAHDIFEKYDKLLSEGSSPSWMDLERDLKSKFAIGYQSVKTIVNAFYRNSQWTNVCVWFAKGQEPSCPMELKHIIDVDNSLN